MFKNKKDGFTLVEVLTVVMIIAILASVVLVSLDRARERTRDATIKTQVSQLRSSMETDYSFSDGYSRFDITGEDFLRIKEEIENMGGVLHGPYFSGDNHHYCAYAELASDSQSIFCIDSSGDAVRIDDGASTDCNDIASEPSCQIVGGLGDPGDYCTDNADCKSNDCDTFASECR